MQEFSGDRYRPGDHKALCDICGRTRYASEMKHNWKRQFVCSDTCWEARHPQDFYRGFVDRATVPGSQARPQGEFQFQSTPVTPDDL